jgi:hypothetical protein
MSFMDRWAPWENGWQNGREVTLKRLTAEGGQLPEGAVISCISPVDSA